MPGADPANARQNYYNIPFNVFAFSRLSHDTRAATPACLPELYNTVIFAANIRKPTV